MQNALGLLFWRVHLMPVLNVQLMTTTSFMGLVLVAHKLNPMSQKILPIVAMVKKFIFLKKIEKKSLILSFFSLWLIFFLDRRWLCLYPKTRTSFLWASKYCMSSRAVSSNRCWNWGLCWCSPRFFCSAFLHLLPSFLSCLKEKTKNWIKKKKVIIQLGEVLFMNNLKVMI